MAHLYSPEEALEEMETFKGSEDQGNMPYRDGLKASLIQLKNVWVSI